MARNVQVELPRIPFSILRDFESQTPTQILFCLTAALRVHLHFRLIPPAQPLARSQVTYNNLTIKSAASPTLLR